MLMLCQFVAAATLLAQQQKETPAWLAVFAVVVVVVLLPIGIWFVLRLNKDAFHNLFAAHAEENNLKYEVLKTGTPPITLWGYNKSGDVWGKVRIDNRESWVRIRYATEFEYFNAESASKGCLILAVVILVLLAGLLIYVNTLPDQRLRQF